MEASFFTTNDLTELNNRAVATQRNRSLTDELINILDPNGLHVVEDRFLHNDEEWRLRLLCKVNDEDAPVHVALDVSFDDFDSYARTITI